MLPLAEFTAGRNALAKRLKLAGRGDDAEKVKAIPKPPLSAWAVNQLYWNHRSEFKRLLDAGKQLAQAHASQLTGTGADVGGRIANRREAVSALLRLADIVLRSAGHSVTPDTLRRIETTLEALSTSTSIPGAPLPGQLTDDVAPLGFDSLVALMPMELSTARRDKHIPDIAGHKLKLAAALVTARESELRQAEENLVKSRAAVDEAMRRTRALSVEAERSEQALHAAESALQQARTELDRLENNRQSPADIA